MFGSSRILTKEEEAQTLFYNLPFVSKAVSTHITFQGGDAGVTERYENPDVDLLQASLSNENSPNATLFIIKSGDYTFGGYASNAWR